MASDPAELAIAPPSFYAKKFSSQDITAPAPSADDSMDSRDCRDCHMPTPASRSKTEACNGPGNCEPALTDIDMGIAHYLREIGRGKEGARSLDAEQAFDLMSQLLSGRLSDLEVGAFALAMRIKGESVAELDGFLRATHTHCVPWLADLRRSGAVVLLPSYNGARKLPNLTALLALLLAQEGLQVLVHGPESDPQRVTTSEIFRILGLPIANSAMDIEHSWARREPVFVSTDTLCPPLQQLLDVRRTVGLRNSGHTVAKLLAPFQREGSIRVVNYTHPEYARLLAEFLRHDAGNAMLMRGTEGEPVADPRRMPRLDVLAHGEIRTDLSLPPHDGILTQMPVLPRTHDAPTTALYIQSVMSGEKPGPEPLLRQVEALRRLASLLDTPAHEKSA